MSTSLIPHNYAFVTNFVCVFVCVHACVIVIPMHEVHSYLGGVNEGRKDNGFGLVMI